MTITDQGLLAFAACLFDELLQTSGHLGVSKVGLSWQHL